MRYNKADSKVLSFRTGSKSMDDKLIDTFRHSDWKKTYEVKEGPVVFETSDMKVVFYYSYTDNDNPAVKIVCGTCYGASTGGTFKQAYKKAKSKLKEAIDEKLSYIKSFRKKVDSEL